MEDTTKTDPPSDARRVRVPWYPTYREVRGLLAVWPGLSRADITKLHSTIMGLTGSTVDPVDWRTPDVWIPQRLSGDQRKLAHAIWTGSNKTANPRYTAGSWSLVRHYELIEEDLDGTLQLTDRGRDFLNHRLGDAESLLDTQEGLTELVTVVADSGPAQLRDFEKAWTEFLREWHSGFQAPASVRDTLRRRLNNLLDRGLIERERAKYTVTDDGLSYLERVLPEPGLRQMIRKLAKEQKAGVRKSLREHLLQMDPKAFEELVGRLLEEMDYQNVEVVGQSGDRGVDVVADIQVGVTSVREVVQAKRHKGTIQRKELDALRGSLYEFNAIRGSIFATSRFARGAVRAAFARGSTTDHPDRRRQYSVRTYWSKAGITCLQRTTTLPDGVRVRGSHCVAIGEAGEIQITFHPAAVDLCHEEFEQLGMRFHSEAGSARTAHGTRWAADRWYLPARRTVMA